MLDYAARRRSGIIDHDVDLAELGRAVLYKFLRLIIIGKVGYDGEDLNARRIANFPGGGLQHVGASRADGHIHTFLRQAERDSLAYSFATPSDQRGFAL